ncbi:hypothetical protein N9C84_04115 [Desulfobacterales bacterium]|nr:hypothetical protein [Desulfobacterales bacterium]
MIYSSNRSILSGDLLPPNSKSSLLFNYLSSYLELSGGGFAKSASNSSDGVLVLAWDHTNRCFKNPSISIPDSFIARFQYWLYSYFKSLLVSVFSSKSRSVIPPPSGLPHSITVFNLPEDVVIYLREHLDYDAASIVLVSRSAKEVIKIGLGISAFKIRAEHNALTNASKTSMSGHVPELLFSFVDKAASYSAITSSYLYHGSLVLAFPFNRVHQFSKFLRKNMISCLSDYYRISGLEILEASECTKMIQSLSESQSFDINSIDTIFSTHILRDFANTQIPMAIIHGGLEPSHVFLHNNSWSLIDFDGARRLPIAWDFLWYVFSRHINSKSLYACLINTRSYHFQPLREAYNAYIDTLLYLHLPSLSFNEFRKITLCSLLFVIFEEGFSFRVGIRNKWMSNLIDTIETLKLG